LTYHCKFVFLAVLVLAQDSICQQSADPLGAARFLLQAGALAKAEASLATYISAHPDSADAHFLLGYVLFREQKAKESLAEFTAGAKYRRPDASELRTVASDYVLLGDYADADKWFTEVTRENPADDDAWYLLGRSKYSESGFTEAVAAFERALALHPKYVEAENNLGLCWRELNDTVKATAAFQTAIDWQGNAPTDAQPFLNLGTLLADQGDTGKAVPLLAKAAALSPQNPRIHDEFAKVYEAQSRLPEAQSELEKAIALAPNSSELHFKLGRIYRLEGRAALAKREFDICDKLNSTHSSVETPNPYIPQEPPPH
jgi:tetratricopeptide (TPR) repeat protein